jgi:serine O-acetyltransferase
VVLRPVPANTTVVGVPARVVREEGMRVKADSISGATRTDPCEECLALFNARFEELEAKIAELRSAPAGSDSAT